MDTNDALGFTAAVLDEIHGEPVSDSRINTVLFFAHLLSLKKYGKPKAFEEAL